MAKKLSCSTNQVARAFVQRHQADIIGVLHGWDRLRLQGTLRSLYHPSVMNYYLKQSGVLWKDFKTFVTGLTDRVRQAAVALAIEHRRPMIYLPSSRTSKEDAARQIQERDKVVSGLIAVFSCVEPCRRWIARGNRTTQKLELRLEWGKCIHLYFYWLHEKLGFLHLRLQTWFPFLIQVCLNGREWLARQMDSAGIAYRREGNCFVGGSDLAGLNRLAQQLDGIRGLARLAQVVDRWVYSACLCFALNFEQQKRSGFRYAYSCYQLEYSRNLLFKSGRQLDEIYQGLIDRTRRLLDVPRLKTIFGRKQRPSKTQARDGRLEKIIERSVYDLTVFKVHFGKLTLKMYDKGERVLRVEIIVHNIEELRCGKGLEKLPGMLERLEGMVVAFLGVVQAAHLSFVDGQQLDALAAPSVRGVRRTAGVDLQKARLRAVAQAVIAQGVQPEGFSAAELAERVRGQQGRAMASYVPRQAAYDLRKLRGKSLVERIGKTRRYRVRRPGIRTLAALLILREQVFKPVLAGVCRPKRGRPPKNLHPLDVHYQKLQGEMLATLQTLKLAA